MRADPPRDQELIEAVVATVVTLDPDRSRMLKEADFRLITTEFRDARDNELPAGEWTETAANLSRKLPNLPKSALQQVRVHQGVFPLPNRKPRP
jgi:hypothetical protein